MFVDCVSFVFPTIQTIEKSTGLSLTLDLFLSPVIYEVKLRTIGQKAATDFPLLPSGCNKEPLFDILKAQHKKPEKQWRNEVK